MKLNGVIVREHDKFGLYCIVGLKANGISEYRKEFGKLRGTKVTIEDKTYEVKAIESFALHDSQNQSTAAFYLKEL